MKNSTATTTTTGMLSTLPETYNLSECKDYNLTSIESKIFQYHTILRSTHKILLIFTIIVIIIGSIQNFISFLCFNQMKKRNSQNVYLKALSIVQFLNIQINLLIPMMMNEGYFDNFAKNFPEILSKIFCHSYGYLIDIFLLLPPWIMVVLATERLCAIIWPFQKNIFATAHNARRVLFIVHIIVFIWCTYKFVTPGIEINSAFHESDPFSKRSDHFCRKGRQVVAWLVNLSTVTWSIIPYILIFIINCIIIQKVKLAIFDNVSIASKKTSSKNYKNPSEKIKKVNQTTKVVIVLSILFICLCFPTGIVFICDITILHTDNKCFAIRLLHQLKMRLARKYALLLTELNMIIDFPIYILTMRNFRLVSFFNIIVCGFTSLLS
jgi:hypothetical protein